MIQSHVFISVLKHFNPYSANLLGMHKSSQFESFGQASLHANPLSFHSRWYWETFIQCFCQMTQFLRSKNRQKGDQYFYLMSDFCENCNPHSSDHTTAAGERLVDIRFAETCKLTLFTFWKIFYQFEKWDFIACSNRQFAHADLYVHSWVWNNLVKLINKTIWKATQQWVSCFDMCWTLHKCTLVTA